jgi:hypothetical protein
MSKLPGVVSRTAETLLGRYSAAAPVFSQIGALLALIALLAGALDRDGSSTNGYSQCIKPVRGHWHRAG